MGRSEGKKPKWKQEPQTKKQPRSIENVENSNDLAPQWSFIIFDSEKRWSDTTVNFCDIARILKSYESMTCGEVLQDKKRNHYIPISDLIPEAQKRLEELKQNDIDEIFRFRFNGTQRLWGIREGRVFKCIWWDPEHLICPSTPK